MGVDARMLLRIKQGSDAFTEDKARKLSVELVEAFGNRLFVIRPGSSWLPQGRHAIEIISDYTQDGPDVTPNDGETFAEVHLSGRYYGVGYECGHLPDYIAIAEWLEAKLPNVEILYGGIVRESV